jgi:transcriptional regulator with XRE-family HTH domain
MMPGRRRIDEIPAGECAIIGANIRILRHRNGWTQAQLGEQMGWRTNSTVCAAEGHRGGRQRTFTTDEVERLAAIFGIPVWQLRTRCANCEGHPPAGFSCLTCEAGRGSPHPGAQHRPTR